MLEKLALLKIALCSAPTFRNADWTDTYLAAFAQLAGLRLVSFDKGFANYQGLAWLPLAASLV